MGKGLLRLTPTNNTSKIEKQIHSIILFLNILLPVPPQAEDAYLNTHTNTRSVISSSPSVSLAMQHVTPSPSMNPIDPSAKKVYDMLFLVVVATVGYNVNGVKSVLVNEQCYS